MTFTCNLKEGSKSEKWTGKIVSLEDFGSHYQMRIESRSGITVIFGETTFGNFACMPDFNAGCHLATFDDEFYNTEKLVSVMNPVDGVTVARALSVLFENIEKECDFNDY